MLPGQIPKRCPFLPKKLTYPIRAWFCQKNSGRVSYLASVVGAKAILVVWSRVIFNSQATSPFLTIVIPAYNEESRLPCTLSDVSRCAITTGKDIMRRNHHRLQLVRAG